MNEHMQANACPQCGAPVQGVRCAHCGSTFKESTPIPKQTEKGGDVFAKCQGDQQLSGVGAKIDGGEFNRVVVSGINNILSNFTTRTLSISGLGTKATNIIVKDLDVRGSNIDLSGVIVYGSLNVSGLNVSGTVRLAHAATFSSSGLQVALNVERF